MENLLFSNPKDRNSKDEIALLTLLIEKWDSDHNTLGDLDPIELLRSFMKDHRLKSKDLATILGISEGYVSDILHDKKGLSKAVIRILADYFKVSQEALIVRTISYSVKFTFEKCERYEYQKRIICWLIIKLQAMGFSQSPIIKPF